MWLCIISYRQFEDTFKNAQLRKVKKTQPHRILSCKQLKVLLKNQSSKTLHQSKLAIWGEIWGEKSNKYDLCDFASIQADNMRRHFKKHDWEISNKCAHININYVNNTWKLNYKMFTFSDFLTFMWLNFLPHRNGDMWLHFLPHGRKSYHVERFSTR